ncbi:MAG: patatin-like phospholipase family protein [Longimicrobiales bacterium]
MTLWGPLAQRYESAQPRKLLALDGGGIRGVLTLEILHALETQLRDATGRGSEFRLCDYFDYIAGTSTGAIIAAGLARGMSVDALLDFYTTVGPQMFDKRFLIARLRSLYEAGPLERKLKEVFGADTTLRPEDLRCLLLVVTRNVTTDSPWPISSNPLAKYNNPAHPDCNLRIPLWKIVRASTAAPIFFPPEVIAWDPSNAERAFVFVDGGITPYNNPAFLLFRQATLEPFNLRWITGESKLLLVSIGTGSAPSPDDDVDSPEKNLAANLIGLPSTFMYGMLIDQDINCRAVGRCVAGAPIDRELGDLIPRDGTGAPIPLYTDLGRSFRYARYNADLRPAALASAGFNDLDPGRVSRLDAVDQIDNLRRIGRHAGQQVDVRAFGAPFVT